MQGNVKFSPSNKLQDTGKSPFLEPVISVERGPSYYKYSGTDFMVYM